LYTFLFYSYFERLLMKKTHDYTYIFKVEKMNKEGRRFESDQHRRSSHYVDFSNVIEIILVSMKSSRKELQLS